MWAIPYLMLRTPVAVETLNRAALSGVMSRLATSIAGHPGLIVRVPTFTCTVVVVMVPVRTLIRTLRAEVISLISLSLDSTLFIVVVPFLHRLFQIYCGVI